MEHNDNNNLPYLILLRVESYPQGLWRALQGNVYTVPFTRVEKSAVPAAAWDEKRKGDHPCSAP